MNEDLLLVLRLVARVDVATGLALHKACPCLTTGLRPLDRIRWYAYTDGAGRPLVRTLTGVWLHAEKPYTLTPGDLAAGTYISDWCETHSLVSGDRCTTLVGKLHSYADRPAIIRPNEQC